jgi:hypothetical protein
MPFVHPKTTYFNQSTTRGQIDQDLTFGTFLHSMQELVYRQQPLDLIVPLKSCMVRFENHRATLQRITGRNLLSEAMTFDQRGWQMLSSFVLNSTGTRKSIEIQATEPFSEFNTYAKDRLMTRGEQLAAMQMAWWINNKAPDRNILLRTVVKENRNGQLERVIRSVQTPSYTVFDELEYLELIRDTEPGIMDRPLLKAKHSSEGMWIRLLEEQVDRLELNQLVRTKDFWNSAVSRRKAGIGEGFLRLVCTNGMTSHERDSHVEFRHTGDKHVIRTGLKSNMEFQKAKRDGVMDRYNRALDVAIDDAWEWMEDTLGAEKNISATTVEKVRMGMRDETSSSIGTLANVIDGMTLIAQDDSFDTFDSWELERTASKILAKGLREADRNNGRILVKELQ